MRTLIISDIHVGDVRFDSQAIIHLLNSENYDRLVINGDFIDLWVAKPKTIRKDPLIKFVEKLAETKEVIWILGNHDYDAPNKLVLLGVTTVESLLLSEGNKSIQIIHGNRVYAFENKSWLDKVLTKINQGLYKMFGLDIQRWMQRFRSYSVHTQHRREQLLKSSPADLTIIGHTHKIGYACNPDGQELLDAGSTVLTKSYIILENGDAWLGFIPAHNKDY